MRLTAVLMVALAVAGCGSSASSHGTATTAAVRRASAAGVRRASAAGVRRASAAAPCAGYTRSILARTADTAPAKVAAVRYTANSGAASCRFTVTGAATGRVVVSLEFDTEPQAYVVLEREIVEDSQQFGTVRTYPPPQAITGIGLEADWFPAADKVETTDGHTIFGVYITDWPRASNARQRRLAVQIARPLVAPSPKHGTLAANQIVH